MATTLRQDPLLGIARAILTFLMVVTILAGCLMAVLVPAVLIGPEHVLAELGDKPGVVPQQVAWAICVLFALVAGMMALAWLFLRLLQQIVDSVSDGDPFIPANAERLRKMAWLTLAIQAVGLPVGALAIWIGNVTEDADFTFEFSFSALLLALILFILARVFQRGAAMREELEGTV